MKAPWPISLLFRNRATPEPKPTPKARTAPVAVAVGPDETRQPNVTLSDPLQNLKPEHIETYYRRHLNNGDMKIPTWCLHEAARVLPMLGDKMRFWRAAVSGLDWTINLADAETETALAEKQAAALRKAYDRLNIREAVGHLALARFYGFSVLAVGANRLEPLNWWNWRRDGLYGDWFYDPKLNLVRSDKLPAEARMNPETHILREVENNLLLEALRVYLRAQSVENWWDKNLEQESQRQVVVVTPEHVPSEGPDGASFKTAAERIAKGGSGYMPFGTQIIYPPASRGLPFYEQRLAGLDAQLTKALTGSMLTMLTAPGSGTLAGNAHAETLQTVIVGEAAEISECFNRQFDEPLLKRAGLLAEGERALAYFALVPRRQADPAQEVALTAQLSAAGYRRSVEQLAEATGYDLTEAAPVGVPDVGTPDGEDFQTAARFVNRTAGATAEAIREGVAVRRLGAWDAPVREWFERLAQKLGGGSHVDAEFLNRVEAALDAMPPDLPDAEALARFLEQAMAGALVEGAQKAADHAQARPS